MNFNQWRNYAAKSDVSKVTYICGDQHSLIELVLDDIKEILKVPATDYISVDASQSVDIWELASQYPLDPESNRLTVVRNADKVLSYDELADWLAQSRNNPKNFLVLISSQSDAPGVYVKGKKTSYVSHIELIRAKGKFIKCSKPNDDDLVKWCQSYGLAQQSAEFLIQRTSSDTSAMLSVLRKIRIWNGSPNIKALQLLCDEQSLDSVADYLILQEKKSAMLALAEVNTSEYAKILARLDSRLDYMLDINRCVVRRMYDVDIVQATGIKIFLVKKFKSVAKDYDFEKVKYRRQVVALTDAYLRQGATTGVMEGLIALW